MAFQGDSIYWVEVEKVVPNPFQPRREFDQNKLQELADSIRMYGVLQPLTVTRSEVQQEDGTFYTEYELIAGERRLRASKLAGTAQVPVIIREGEQNEQEKLELAIIENLQREDLNAVDRAIAFRQLADTFKLSHVQVAKKVGRSREYVSNTIRLLGLPEHMLDSLKQGNMMEGHARTLLMLTDRPEEQEVIYKEILLKKLSVREVERIIRKIATDKIRKRRLEDSDVQLIELEKQFTETLGTRVQIQKTDFGGKLTIDYFSEDDLSAILKRMSDEAIDTEFDQQQMEENISQHTPLQMEDREPVQTPATEPQTDSLPTNQSEIVEPVETQSDNSFTHSPEIPEMSPEQPKTQPEQTEEVVANTPQPDSLPIASQQSPEPEMIKNPETAVPEQIVSVDTEIKAFHNEPPIETPLAENDSEVEKSNAELVENNTNSGVAQSNEDPSSDNHRPTNSNEDDGDLYSIRNFGV